MGCSGGFGLIRLVEQKQSRVVLALQDVKALIARFLDGFLVIQDGGLTKRLDPIGFHVDVDTGDVHRSAKQGSLQSNHPASRRPSDHASWGNGLVADPAKRHQSKRHPKGSSVQSIGNERDASASLEPISTGAIHVEQPHERKELEDNKHQDAGWGRFNSSAMELRTIRTESMRDQPSREGSPTQRHIADLAIQTTTLLNETSNQSTEKTMGKNFRIALINTQDRQTR